MVEVIVVVTAGLMVGVMALVVEGLVAEVTAGVALVACGDCNVGFE